MNRIEKDICLCFIICSIANLAIATNIKDMFLIYSLGFIMLYSIKRYQRLHPDEFIQELVESDKVKE